MTRVLCILGTCILLASQAPAGPPTTSPQPASTLPPDIKAGLDALAASLRNPEQRQDALGRLSLIQSAYSAAMEQLAEDNDAEVRARAVQMLDNLLMNVRLLRATNHLPEAMRQMMQSAVQAAPAMFHSTFSSRSQPLGLGAVANAGLSQAQREPVLLLSLHSNNAALQVSAIRFIADSEINNDLLNVIVADLAAEGFNNTQLQGRYFGMVELSTLTGILENSRSPSVAAKLMAIYLAPSSMTPDLKGSIAKSAAATGQLGIIPALMGRLKDTKSVQVGVVGGTMSVAPSDGALAALIMATGQKAEDYELTETSVGSVGSYIGFKDDDSRTAAIKKFMDWWDKHKDQPPYKDVKPLEIPKFPPPRIERWDY